MATTTYPDAQAWQRDRTRFNHDWLMVSFLTFLQAWSEDLDAAGQGAPLAPEARLHLQQWSQHWSSLVDLLADAEWALGPAGKQHGGVSGAGPDASDAALLVLAQGVWCERSGIRHRLRDLHDLALAADTLVRLLLQRQPAHEPGAALYRLCLQVSRSLSALPSAGYLA